MIELLNIDCMDYMAGLEDNAFELAIVDPPYGIGLSMSGSHSFKGGKTKSHEQKNWNNSVPDRNYFNELIRVSQRHIVWGSNYFPHAADLFGVGRIIHDKQVTPFLAASYSHADLAATNCQKRITLFAFQWSGNVQAGVINSRGIVDKSRGLECRIHPTQKPIALYEWLLKNYAKEGDRILDTHLGSGSSAIAAHYGGFDFVGCELDPDYFEAAKRRFNEETRQVDMFSGAVC